MARKALILARRMGVRVEMADVEVESLYPAAFAGLSVEEFMTRLPELDGGAAERVAAAAARGAELRYAAVVEGGRVRVGVTEVPADSPLGRLRGTGNLVEVSTRVAFPDTPLVIAGPGAGAGVTASGILSDILELHAARW